MLFNVVMGGLVSAATGFNPLAVVGVGSALTFAMPKLAGMAPMAVQKEIWLTSIVENLFADNSFLSKAFNADEFVNAGKTVHIPNAGSASSVSKNRTSLPATVKTRTDLDLTFNLDEFTTDPIRIPQADTVELSYNKRESCLKNDKSKLIEEVSNAFIYAWSPSSTYVVRTTGSAALAHVPAATGNRKALKSADLLTAMNTFNAANVPQEGRYALVDAVMYGQLLEDMTANQVADFNKQADIANGTLGKIYSFNVMMRSKAGRYNSALAAKAWTADNGVAVAGATTDHGAVICWHEGSVCRAMGEVNMFEEVGSPTYYGDTYSFLVRAGGRPMRNGVEGLLAIVQDTSA